MAMRDRIFLIFQGCLALNKVLRTSARSGSEPSFFTLRPVRGRPNLIGNMATRHLNIRIRPFPNTSNTRAEFIQLFNSIGPSINFDQSKLTEVDFNHLSAIDLPF